MLIKSIKDIFLTGCSVENLICKLFEFLCIELQWLVREELIQLRMLIKMIYFFLLSSLLTREASR